MNGSVNKFLFVGRLTKDPELKYSQAGIPVCTFTVVTSERWKGKDGKSEEKSQFHKITVWRKLAEICGQYLTKGTMVCVEGKVDHQNYTGKDGVKRYLTNFMADSMQILDGWKKDGKEPDETIDTTPVEE